MSNFDHQKSNSNSYSMLNTEDPDNNLYRSTKSDDLHQSESENWNKSRKDRFLDTIRPQKLIPTRNPTSSTELISKDEHVIDLEPPCIWRKMSHLASSLYFLRQSRVFCHYRHF